MLPERMRERAPQWADYVVVREFEDPDMIGYIQESGTLLQPFTCSAQGDTCLSSADTLVGAFMGIVTATEGRVSPAGTAALVIHPRGDVTEISFRPGVSNAALKREHLGRYLITRVALSSQMDMWFGADAEDTQPVNLTATTLARSYGFIWRVYHGPVMLCFVDGKGTGTNLTCEQVLRLFTSQQVQPREEQVQPKEELILQP
jgi:hypothetical protein